MKLLFISRNLSFSLFFKHFLCFSNDPEPEGEKAVTRGGRGRILRMERAFVRAETETKGVRPMSCNNTLFGTNCCTWLIIILLLVLFNNEGIFGCGCGNNGGCGCNGNCGC